MNIKLLVVHAYFEVSQKRFEPKIEFVDKKQTTKFLSTSIYVKLLKNILLT